MLNREHGGAWDGYFARHFGIRFNAEELRRQKRFLAGQLRIIEQISPIDSGDKILEIGCGIGALISLVKERGVADITALELDSEAAEFVRQSENVSVLTSSIEESRLDGEKFTKIFALEVLEHIHNPVQDLKKIHDLLTEGGLFIATTPYPFNKNIISDETHLYVLPPLCWRRILEAAEFREIKMQPLSAIPLLYRFSHIFSLYLPMYIPGLKLVSTTLIIAKK